MIIPCIFSPLDISSSFSPHCNRQPQKQNHFNCPAEWMSIVYHSHIKLPLLITYFIFSLFIHAHSHTFKQILLWQSAPFFDMSLIVMMSINQISIAFITFVLIGVAVSFSPTRISTSWKPSALKLVREQEWQLIAYSQSVLTKKAKKSALKVPNLTSDHHHDSTSEQGLFKARNLMVGLLYLSWDQKEQIITLTKRCYLVHILMKKTIRKIHLFGQIFQPAFATKFSFEEIVLRSVLYQWCCVPLKGNLCIWSHAALFKKCYWMKGEDKLLIFECCCYSLACMHA